jgi:diphthine synthase
MFYLIGIGLKPEHLTVEALNTLKECDQIFLENYTSEYSEGLITQLQKLIGRNVKGFGRKEVEENMEAILLSSKKNNVALMIFGNPLTATTHIQLLLDAKKLGVKTKIIPGISISNMIAHSGLDEYKFGRTVTICYHENGFEPESFYDQILENKKIGLHTLCLLDIKKDENRLMNCKEAISILNKISENRKSKNNWIFIGMIAMAGNNQKIIVDKKNILDSIEVEKFFPQSLVIAGNLNEKEKEVLKELF